MKITYLTLVLIVLFTISCIKNSNTEKQNNSDLDSLEQTEILLNKNHRFICGIQDYWGNSKLKKIEIDSLGSQKIEVGKNLDKITLNLDKKIMLKDSITQKYLSSAFLSNEFEFFNIKNSNYYVIKSRIVNATKYNTLFYYYLLIDIDKKKSHLFKSLASTNQTFYLDDESKEIGVIEFNFSKLFYEKTIYSMDISQLKIENNRLVEIKTTFSDCICK